MFFSKEDLKAMKKEILILTVSLFSLQRPPVLPEHQVSHSKSPERQAKGHSTPSPAEYPSAEQEQEEKGREMSVRKVFCMQGFELSALFILFI